MRNGRIEWRNGRLDGLLTRLLMELRRYASAEPPTEPEQLLNWLRRHTGSEFALVTDTGTAEAASEGFPHDLLDPLRPALARVAGGALAAVATQAGGRQVHVEALETRAPRPVLVTAGDAPLDREAAALASHAGSVIAVARRAHLAERTARGYQDKARQLRFAVFTALMAGDPDLARRMTTGAVPRLLSATRVRVHLLHCAPGDRDRLAQTYQDAAGYHGAGLMVPCPVHPHHFICVLADDESPPEAGPFDAASPDGVPPDRHDATLRRLVLNNPHYALGVSGPHPLAATAEAYAEAGHALAVARNLPDRVADYRGRLPLARLLPRPAAPAWAGAFLDPLASAPKLTSDIARLAVSVSRSGVARLLGISRNTVTTHIGRAEALLGLDLTDVRARAALDLALSVAGSGPWPPARGRRGEGPGPSLDALLRTGAAATWAADLLKPLADLDRPGPGSTLRVWIEANTDAREAGRRLGISRNTVRAHLRAAESLLNRDLLTLTSGVHDVVHALRIAGPRPRR
ncbi:helix-turn-helix domain-containing protein [Streptomyces marincola]|uniref:helix-turn-helix domain-containing protein n=1 Tax=Streptomyces marincola TaxID=2878388 RepID=UPI001CF4F450|nr:helix-turn-helix domain-containing protein [Streptomyces marincola]UCM88260.1 helix-turn-helix domain-containing protein [Streptomyces marincola]